MTNCPHRASKAAVGRAATISSSDRPCALSRATFSRTATSMSRKACRPARSLTGGPWPGMTMVESVVAARLASAARIEPSMLPPVE